MTASLPVAVLLLLLQTPGQATFAPQSIAFNDIRQVRETSSPTEAPPAGMVYVTAGEVVMGISEERVRKLGQNDSHNMTLLAAETPPQVVDVDAFFIDETEVTNLQWKVFLDATGRKPSEFLVEYSWPGGKIPENQEYFPVTNVNIPEITDYLRWCGKRLPAEEEWTRAARGDHAEYDYPFGETWDYRKCQSGLTVPQKPTATGSFPEGASPFGVLDMAGNVWEWTDSGFTPFPGFEPLSFKWGRETKKLTPSFDHTHKVIKGGCFTSDATLSRIDVRYGQPARDSDWALGFRAARSTHDGLEALRSAYQRLLPPQLAGPKIDETHATGREVTFYDSARRVITGYRFMAFAPRGPERGPRLTKLKRESVDEPFAVGILATSEAMKSPALPAGEYTVAFKGAGESKAYKEKRKEDKGRIADAADPEGATAPWPGVPIHDVVEDIAFPQKDDVYLFYNANNVVVGFLPAERISEAVHEPTELEVSPDGRTWAFDFSVDIIDRKVPRFGFTVELAGEGLKK